jgi:hypothetical protein
LRAKPALAHSRWFDDRRGITAQQEIAPEAENDFHSWLLMGLNTESEQEPQNLLTFQGISSESPEWMTFIRGGASWMHGILPVLAT